MTARTTSKGTSTGSRPRPAAVLPAERRLAVRARERRSARRRSLGRVVGLTLLGLLPLAGLAWVLLVSTWLGVDRLEVLGAQRLTVQEVTAAAGVPAQTPLARVDLARLEVAVGRLVPVAAVEAHRSWPGTIRVEVTERTAVAGVVDAAGGVMLVDREGVPFAAAPSLPEGLVRLEVAQVGPQDPATRAALLVDQELPEALRRQVRSLQARSASAVVLVLAGDRQVLWGSPGDTGSKAAAVEALLKLPGRVVDVSAPGLAVRRDKP